MRRARGSADDDDGEAWSSHGTSGESRQVFPPMPPPVPLQADLSLQSTMVQDATASLQPPPPITNLAVPGGHFRPASSNYDDCDPNRFSQQAQPRPDSRPLSQLAPTYEELDRYGDEGHDIVGHEPFPDYPIMHAGQPTPMHHHESTYGGNDAGERHVRMVRNEPVGEQGGFVGGDSGTVVRRPQPRIVLNDEEYELGEGKHQESDGARTGDESVVRNEDMDKIELRHLTAGPHAR
jgi:hypothetical protein